MNITPKNNTTNKVYQDSFNVSLTSSDPSSFPMTYDDDMWVVVTEDSSLYSIMGSAGQFSQHQINEAFSRKDFYPPVGGVSENDLSFSLKEKIDRSSFVSGQGIITEYDNDKNKISGKIFISTQEEFDSMIQSANNNSPIDAIIGAGEFVVKQKINVARTTPFRIQGSDGTIIKRNNKVYYKKDAVAETRDGKHYNYRVDISSSPITPFTLFLNDKGDIIPISEANGDKEITRNLKFYKTTAIGRDISSSSTIYDLDKNSTTKEQGDSMGIVDDPESTYNYKYFLVPGDEISIDFMDSGGSVFGFLEANWTTIFFKLTGTKVNVTIDNILHDYFIAEVMRTDMGSDNYIIDSDPNYLYKNAGYNQYILFNFPSETQIWYDSSFLYIPNGIGSVEVVDGVFSNDKSTNYFIQAQVKARYEISGIKFKNFTNCLRFNAPSQNDATNDPVVITNCNFENILGFAINMKLGSTPNNLTKKEKSIISGCTFINCAYTNFSSIYINGINTSDNGSNVTNCYNTGIVWAEINNCYCKNYSDDVCHYKNSKYPQIWMKCIDAVMKDCEVVNFPRVLIQIASRGTITVKGCHAWNTDRFLGLKRNLQLDAGLIYVSGQDSYSSLGEPDDPRNVVVIDGCVVHGNRMVGGSAGNGRGIYIDDGRGNVTTRNCIVYDICGYSYDSRRVSNYYRMYCFKNDSKKVYMHGFSNGYSGYVYEINDGIPVRTDYIVDVDNSTITLDGIIYTYSEQDMLYLSSARNICKNNVLEGNVRFVGGEGLGGSNMPLFSENLLLGDYTVNIGEGIDDNTSVKRKSYSTNGGIKVSSYSTLINPIKKLVTDGKFPEDSYISDWLQTDPTSLDYIKNKPDIGFVKMFYLSTVNNDMNNHYAHLIKFDDSDDFTVKDWIEVEFISVYRPYSYKIIISSKGTFGDTGNFRPTISGFEGSSGYDSTNRRWYGEVLSSVIWKNNTTNKWCIASWCDALVEFRNAQGGIFTIRSSKNIEFTIDYCYTNIENQGTIVNLKRNENVIESITADSSSFQVKQVLCDNPYYKMYTGINGYNSTAVNTNTIVIGWIPYDNKGNLQCFSKTLLVMDKDSNIYQGLLTQHGLYNTVGPTSMKPVVQRGDIIQYYDTSTNVSEWCVGNN